MKKSKTKVRIICDKCGKGFNITKQTEEKIRIMPTVAARGFCCPKCGTKYLTYLHDDKMSKMILVDKEKHEKELRRIYKNELLERGYFPQSIEIFTDIENKSE